MVESQESRLALTSQLDTLVFNPLPPESRQPMLRFPLGAEDSALVSLEQITEILRIEITDILSVPEMPSCILGICRWRGEMLWLIDFNDFTGYSLPGLQEHGPSSLLVIVFQFANQSIGIGVPQVNDVELHDLKSLQAVVPGFFPSELMPLVAGVLPGCSDAVLNMEAITQCPLWKNHSRETI